MSMLTQDEFTVKLIGHFESQIHKDVVKALWQVFNSYQQNVDQSLSKNDVFISFAKNYLNFVD